MAAGRTLVTGQIAARPDDALDDARRMGLDLTEADLNADAGLWPWHASAVRAMQLAMTQWRIASTMERVVTTGLDYAAAAIAWSAAGIEMTPDLFDEVQVIERGCLRAYRVKIK